MSDALQRLIEAVEAGSDAPFHDLTYSDLDGFGQRFINLVQQANHGDLNAAKALHDALLPEHDWERDDTGRMSVTHCNGDYSAKVIGNPARAWLLAILRAYQQVQQ
ncbi:hypothetical protein [Paracoccus sp. SY]|uniref:hypothetical protein n=1 Tax=Paracoccus sp. SY TaxID=1330255 RepID=UPI000CD1EB30|nr:hypothetical protein [Paracoccus sp. SY]